MSVKIFFAIFAFCLFPYALFAATEIRDTEIESYLTELITPLARAADVPDGRLRVHILDDDDFNAFVTGGEDVYVYTGLLTQIKSPAALQAVIAHELGHMLGGHMAQMADRMHAEMVRSLIVQALGIGLMVANPMAGAGLMAGAGGIARQSLLSFTRDEERLADNMGIDLMIKSGLSADGFLTVMEQMQEINGAAEMRINPHNTNHPMTTERLKNVKDKITKYEIRNTKYDPQYEIIRAKLIGYLAPEKRVADLYPATDISDAAIYARAIRNMRSGNLKMAQKGTQTLTGRAPKNPYYYELLGDIYFQLGDYDASVIAYEKSLKQIKNQKSEIINSQIQTALALVLSERKKPGDLDMAKDLCRRALLSEKLPLAYYVLSRALTGGESDWAMAEFYHLQKNEKLAKKYARDAQKKLPKNAPEYIKSGDLLK